MGISRLEGHHSDSPHADIRLRGRPNANALAPYYYSKNMPSRKGKLCERVVLIERGTLPGEPQMQGIITSYGGVRGTL
jgi:hypothetical protein